MTHASQLSLHELEEHRAQTIRRGNRTKVVMSKTCPKTRGGVVISTARFQKDALEAHFFRPTQLNRWYESKKVESAHQALAALDKIAQDLADTKAKKAMAHDITIGTIMVAYSCYTSASARFYQVVGVPHRKKVEVVEIPQAYASGDWCYGSVVPVQPVDTDLLAHGPRQVFTLSMLSGEASARLNSITTLSRWTGTPVSVHCD